MTKFAWVLSGATAVLFGHNLNLILLHLPDERNQGAIWRIFCFHLPSAMMAGFCAMAACIFSIIYLARRKLIFDALAVAVTEIALTFGAAVLVTGMIWARIIWGVWWAWDARLTSTLVVWLMYAGYLMLRRAVDDPTERARNAAVLNIFIAPGIYITWKSIEWWRTLHPAPVLSIRGGGGMAEGMEAGAYWNLLAYMMLTVLLMTVRLRQEARQRELDALRREVHAF